MKKIRLIVLTSVLYFFVYTIQIVVVHRFVNPIVTPLMVMRFAENVFGGEKSLKIKKEWKSIDEISPNMVYAVLVAEDHTFLQHNGFNWDAIYKAMAYNKRHK